MRTQQISRGVTLALAMLLSVFYGLWLPNPTLAQTAAIPRFEPSACKFDIPNNLQEGKNLHCGFVIVPEDHSKPDGPTIKLAIAQLKSPNPAADAVIYLDGGPGGYSLVSTDYYGQAFAPLLKKRDVIMLDQRGVGYSEPLLNCPELTMLYYQLLEEDISKEKAAALGLDATQQCHDRLVKSGIDLTVYNSAQNAADVDMVRQALGYKQFDLYGISYGTRLALTVLRDHPEAIRSVVIDSVVPLDIDLVAGYTRDADRSFKALFSACAAEAACNSAYPDLDKVFYQLVDQVNAKYITAKGKHPVTDKVYNVVIDGDSLINWLFQSLYSTRDIPNLPQMIYEAHAGNFEHIADGLVENVWEDETFSEGMYNSTDCREEVAFTTPDAMIEGAKGVPPELANSFADTLSVQDTFKTCDLWGVGKASAIEDLPVISSIPALVMAGHFDPITPPEYSKRVAGNLSKSFFYEVPNGGHGPSLNGACTFGVVSSFIDNPTAKPNDACLANLHPPTFAVPAANMPIKLIPFTNQTLGISGVAPEGWIETESGVYSPNGDKNAPIRLTHRVRPDGIKGYLAFLKQANNLATIPEPSNALKANGLTWSLYKIDLNGAPLDLARRGARHVGGDAVQ
ncbi:MAG: alpha/beta fold hydrolase, partial [Chloroflexota bacterium]